MGGVYQRRRQAASARDGQTYLSRKPVTVIPGLREAASPESITTIEGYGFRACAFGASRNDGAG